MTHVAKLPCKVCHQYYDVTPEILNNHFVDSVKDFVGSIPERTMEFTVQNEKCS